MKPCLPVFKIASSGKEISHLCARQCASDLDMVLEEPRGGTRKVRVGGKVNEGGYESARVGVFVIDAADGGGVLPIPLSQSRAQR